jgi:transposase
MQTTQMIPQATVGIDLGDRKSAVCVLDTAGEVVERRTIATTRTFVEVYFRNLPPSRVVLEVGRHSPWISRLLDELGHEVIVGNPSKIRGRGRDGRATRSTPSTSPGGAAPIPGCSTLLSSRDCLVQCRTLLVNHVRGVVKSMGERIPECSTPTFHQSPPSTSPTPSAVA